MISQKKQIDFIQYLSRLFKEGDFSATYKFALLQTLADISVERAIEERMVVSVRDITEKMVEHYWRQAKPFGGGEQNYLLQNAGKQSKFIKEIINLQNNGETLNSLMGSNKNWKKLITSLRPTVINGPLWRLQILSNQNENFLYDRYEGNETICFNEGIQECFQVYYDLVTALTRDRWQQKIRSLPSNYGLVGRKGDLENFLFGSQRKSLKKAEELFEDLQEGKCFYCNKELRGNKAVDHFIPWSRYPNDLGHNFVLAHERCNGNKKDLLASMDKYTQWEEVNLVLNAEPITEALSPYFLCNAERSRSVARWAYDNNSVKLWGQ